MSQSSQTTKDDRPAPQQVQPLFVRYATTARVKITP
jgi:hypothetical protein